MTNINFLISAGQFVVSLMNLKQQLLTGNLHSNTFYADDENTNSPAQLPRLSKDLNDGTSFYQNPIIDKSHPDPGVVRLKDESGWILVATSNHVKRHQNTTAFPIYFSEDLVNWEPRGHVFTSSNWPTWAAGRMWAPEIHYVSGSDRYIVYFTAGDDEDKLNVGAAVATSSNPFGPYQDIGQPLIVDENSMAGALDPHYFFDSSSKKQYLIWKEDDPLHPSLIKIRQLNDDGISFRGDEVTILRNTLSGERLVTEAPWMMYKDGYYFLFYSSAWYFEEKYHIRVAKAKSITGPYVKRRLPVLETNWDEYKQGVNTTWIGPGHGSVVSNGDQWWMIYHAWTYGHLDEEPGRRVLLDKIYWNKNWPIVGSGSPSVTNQLRPKISVP